MKLVVVVMVISGPDANLGEDTGGINW